MVQSRLPSLNQADTSQTGRVQKDRLGGPGQIFQGLLHAVCRGFQVPQPVILPHMESSLWINILWRKLCTRYLSTKLPIFKSHTSQKHKSLIRKEIFYHQNHEIIFLKIKERLEYKTERLPTRKMYTILTVRNLLLPLHIFTDLTIEEAADPLSSNPTFFCRFTLRRLYLREQTIKVTTPMRQG